MGFFDQRQTPGQPGGQMSQKQMQQAFFKDVDGLRRDPSGYVQRAGMSVPASIMGNYQAMAMHLIQSGQVPQSRVKMVQPLIDRMMGKR